GGRVVAGHSVGPAYLSWGLSGIAFDNEDTDLWEDSYGTDFDLTFRGAQLTGEFAYTHLRERHASREWSFYLQQVVPIYGPLYGVFRYEHVVSRTGTTNNGE